MVVERKNKLHKNERVGQPAAANVNKLLFEGEDFLKQQ